MTFDIRSWLPRLLDVLFGCRHSNLSRVFTIGRRTYRVCFDCGGEFDYSLATMSTKRQRTCAPASPTTVGTVSHA